MAYKGILECDSVLLIGYVKKWIIYQAVVNYYLKEYEYIGA